MSEIKKINPAEGFDIITRSTGNTLNDVGQAFIETINMASETLNDTANTINETVITPMTDFIQSPHSINQLLDKLQGSYNMAIYGLAKAAIERAPQVSAQFLITETIIKNTIVSKPVAEIANKGFEVANGAVLPEEWLKFGDEAFIKTEEGFKSTSKLIGDNANIIRSTGARVNVEINALFAGIDGIKVWDHYTQNGEDAAEHTGEIIGRASGETIGGAGGFAVGMAAGTAASAAITGAVCGSVVPGVGTLAGLAVGAIIGGVACTFGGDIGATIGSHIDGNNGEIVTL